MTTRWASPRLNKRARALTWLCLVLALISLARYTGGGGEVPSSAGATQRAGYDLQAFDAADFAWPIDVFDSPGGSVSRDPFRRGPALPVSLSLPVVQTPGSPSGVDPTHPLPASEPDERERARAELDSLRLTGVLVREGGVFALLAQGERFHTVRLGDRIDHRFEVTALDVHAIELTDQASGARRRIDTRGP